MPHRKHKKHSKHSKRDHGYSHLAGGALNLIGNLAGKIVTNAIKSGAAQQLAKQVGKELAKDVQGQAVKMAQSHVDNLANALHEKTGLKVDTTELKQKIQNKSDTIKFGGAQIGGSLEQYGAGFPLQLVGNLAGKLVSSAAKSGVANQLIKGVQANASSIGQAMVADAKKQAIGLANQQIDNLASQVQQQTGLKVDTSGVKQNIIKQAGSFF
jgi:cell division septum initiation protein DivIVA